MDESEINRAAASIVECFGVDAEDQAEEMVLKMLNRGDLEEAAKWMKIVQAIIDIENRDEAAS